eukprot:5635354-Pleurochrysis_carterae.AAC.1
MPTDCAAARRTATSPSDKHGCSTRFMPSSSSGRSAERGGFCACTRTMAQRTSHATRLLFP